MSEPITPGALGLDAVQRFMLRAVTHPDGVDAGIEAALSEDLLPDASGLADVVTNAGQLSGRDRLHIYAFAYFDRICSVLSDEYSAVEHLLGTEPFAEAVRGFLVDHPSGTWTLDRVGAPFADWLRDQAEEAGPSWAVAADIARVQRAMDEVWDAPFVDPVSHDELASIAPDRWPETRLIPIPALALLTLGHPVTAAMNAAQKGEPAPLPDPEPSWMCVYRDDATRWRFPLTEQQFAVLSTLHRGGSLADAIGAAADVPGTEFDALLDGVGAWFEEWMGSGLFAAVESK